VALDEGSYIEAYDRLARFVVSYISKLYVRGDWDTINDMASDVWIHAWERRAHYTETGQIQAWLAKLCRNVVIDHIRTKNSRRHGGEVVTFSELTADSDRQFDPECSWATFEYETIFKGHDYRDLIADLSPLQRQIMIGYEAGVPISELARFFNKKEGSIRAIRFRALKSIRSKLKSDTELAGSLGIRLSNKDGVLFRVDDSNAPLT